MYNQVQSLSLNNKLNGYQRFCFSVLKHFIIKSSILHKTIIKLFKQAFTVKDFTGYGNGLAFLLTARLSQNAISNKLVKKELKNLQAERA